MICSAEGQLVSRVLLTCHSIGCVHDMLDTVRTLLVTNSVGRHQDIHHLFNGSLSA